MTQFLAILAFLITWAVVYLLLLLQWNGQKPRRWFQCYHCFVWFDNGGWRTKTPISTTSHGLCKKCEPIVKRQILAGVITKATNQYDQ